MEFSGASVSNRHKHTHTITIGRSIAVLFDVFYVMSNFRRLFAGQYSTRRLIPEVAVAADGVRGTALPLLLVGACER